MSIFSRQKCEEEPKRSRKFNRPKGFGKFPFFSAENRLSDLSIAQLLPASEKPIFRSKIYGNLLERLLQSFVMVTEGAAAEYNKI
jgi:hypothetical protein